MNQSSTFVLILLSNLKKIGQMGQIMCLISPWGQSWERVFAQPQAHTVYTLLLGLTIDSMVQNFFLSRGTFYKIKNKCSHGAFALEFKGDLL